MPKRSYLLSALVLSALLPLTGEILVGNAGAQSPILTFYDPCTWSNCGYTSYGYAVSNAGDVNRDGCPDIIVGAPEHDAHPTISDYGMASVYSGKDGKLLHFFLGQNKEEYLGVAVDGAGDVNRDGYDDLLVGALGNTKNGYRSGAVYVYSGKDGSKLHVFYGTAANDYFGAVVAGVGDINKDGYPDVMAGGGGGRYGLGLAAVFSGKDGKVLFGARGTSTNDLGGHVAAAGDVDRDTYLDFIICGTNSISKTGTTQVFSGKDYKVLRTFTGSTFGGSVSLLGDVNVDGYPDIIIGAGGGAAIVSLKDGKLLHQFKISGSVSVAGDVDRDGIPDVIIGTPKDSTKANRAGAVHVFSGKDGKLLFRAYGDKAGDCFGISVGDAGDVNRDGVPDMVVGAWADNAGEFARVISGTKLSLWTTRNVLSLVQTGPYPLFLDAGVANQQKTYLLLGSLTGTSPGIRVGNVNLPVNPDPYLTFTLNHPNTLISDSFGTLEWYGRATAKFNLPAGLPTILIGTVLHHAFVAADLRKPPYVIDFASNPVLLRIE